MGEAGRTEGESMLNLYRRHTPECPHTDQHYTGCNCPIWCYGVLNGRQTRRSVGTRDMARASKCIDAWLISAAAGGGPMRTLAEAIESYLGDCQARERAESTLRSYSKTLEHFAAFCDRANVRSILELDLGLLTNFRASRGVAASTSGKELETLRAFCEFCAARKWIAENYARKLKAPKDDGPPTLPFECGEVDAILAACNRLEDDNPELRERTRGRARALCLLMLYSGLRISDAVQLARKSVDLETGKLLLRVMKTGALLYVRLGQPAIEALASLAPEGEYFFWTGEGKPATAIGNARRTISRVLSAAGITGHPHRFRDTFSVRLLEKGEDLRTVQLLLGHTSIKTTEKHYAPFVESFQRILDAATAKLDFGVTVQKRTKSTLSGTNYRSDISWRPRKVSKLQIAKAG
jgi:site-specific recombinase XerD